MDLHHFNMATQDNELVYRVTFTSMGRSTGELPHQGIYKNALSALRRGQVLVSKHAHLLKPDHFIETINNGVKSYHVESDCGDVYATVIAEPIL